MADTLYICKKAFGIMKMFWNLIVVKLHNLVNALTINRLFKKDEFYKL